MTVYVDAVQTQFPKDSHTKRWGTKWSHMWCDGDLEELHQMAESMGLKRAYFQNKKGFPHYDIIPSKRTLALKNGAVEMSLRDWYREHPWGKS